MDDAEFLKQFEAGKIHEFPHRAHIRLAWLYLRAEGLEQGARKSAPRILHVTQAHGAPGKYHETITLFWVYLVHYAITLTPEIDDFEEFLALYPHLLDSGLLKRHYSPALIASSRDAWAAPDLKPLPGALRARITIRHSARTPSASAYSRRRCRRTRRSARRSDRPAARRRDRFSHSSRY